MFQERTSGRRVLLRSLCLWIVLLEMQTSDQIKASLVFAVVLVLVVSAEASRPSVSAESPVALLPVVSVIFRALRVQIRRFNYWLIWFLGLDKLTALGLEYCVVFQSAFSTLPHVPRFV